MKENLDKYSVAAAKVDHIDQSILKHANEKGLDPGTETLILFVVAINNLTRAVLAVADAIHNQTEDLAGCIEESSGGIQQDIDDVATKIAGAIKND